MGKTLKENQINREEDEGGRLTCKLRRRGNEEGKREEKKDGSANTEEWSNTNRKVVAHWPQHLAPRRGTTTCIEADTQRVL